MSFRRNCHLAINFALAMALCACGGGGGGAGSHVASTPPPPPAPPPPPTATTDLDIFASPPTGDLAVAGATSSAPYSDPNPLAKLTVDPSAQPSFRYDASTNVYQVELPSGTWETLSTTDGTLPDWGRHATSPSGARVLLGYDRTIDTTDPYPYSTLVRYTAPGALFGWLAIGIPTPSAGLPSSGSATFNGILRGSADVMEEDGWGGIQPTDVTGSVTLSFDFSKAALTGAMRPMLESATPESLGTLSFRNTVYSAGHYTGSFNTNAPGLNSFYGQLTGPHAEELIGAWALPFTLHGSNHEAMGAWVAAKDH